MPSTHDGQRAPGLRFGDPRVMAMLSSLASFAHVIGGLTNAGLREHMVALYDTDYSSGQATYDLRRLRLKGLICRVEGTHTYCVTDHGRRIATFFTKLATRVVVPALTELEAPARPPRQAPTALRTAWRALRRRGAQAPVPFGPRGLRLGAGPHRCNHALTTDFPQGTPTNRVSPLARTHLHRAFLARWPVPRHPPRPSCCEVASNARKPIFKWG